MRNRTPGMYAGIFVSYIASRSKALRPSTSWAIDSEPIRARAIIVKYGLNKVSYPRDQLCSIVAVNNTPCKQKRATEW